MAQTDTPAPGDQPGASNAAGSQTQAGSHPPVVVKKYANRRLYNTESSSYITLDNLAEMVRAGRDFTVYDAKSGEDITRGVLTQIIVEEESKGSSMLPTAFLRQLIGLYGDSLQGVVPRYLEHAMASFARQQQGMRQAMQQTISPFLLPGVEEMGRQNMAMFERALTLFNPFHLPGAAPAPAAEAAEPSPEWQEVERLREEVERLHEQLAAAWAEADAARAAGQSAQGRGGADPASHAADPAPRTDATTATDTDGSVIALRSSTSRATPRGRGKAPGEGSTPA